MDPATMPDLSPFGFWAMLFLLLFAAFMAVVWAFLPFAVFGIKERMDSQAEISRQLLAEVKALRNDRKAEG